MGGAMATPTESCDRWCTADAPSQEVKLVTPRKSADEQVSAVPPPEAAQLVQKNLQDSGSSIPVMSESPGQGWSPQKYHILVGTWKRSDDEDVMEIKADAAGNLQLFWDQRYMYPPSTLYSIPDGRVEMELAGCTHQATLEQGPPLLLRWSDGEVFTQITSGLPVEM